MTIHVPMGFRFAGVHCGIKKAPGKEDFTLIHCPGGATAAGVYTQNLVYAAPVDFDRKRTPSKDVRVVAVNSGNANACTGQRGMEDAQKMAEIAAAAVGASSRRPRHVHWRDRRLFADGQDRHWSRDCGGKPRG
jgi:glutamate N-acetyltransferase/amino-acid N-acetyltransferase